MGKSCGKRFALPQISEEADVMKLKSRILAVRRPLGPVVLLSSGVLLGSTLFSPAEAAPGKKAPTKRSKTTRTANATTKAVKPAPRISRFTAIKSTPPVLLAAGDEKTTPTATVSDTQVTVTLPTTPGTVILTKESGDAKTKTQWTQNSIGPDQVTLQRLADLNKSIIEAQLDATKVVAHKLKVAVTPHGAGFIATVTGEANNENEKAALNIWLSNQTIDGVPGDTKLKLTPLIAVKAAPTPTPPPTHKMDYVLPLTFISSPLLLNKKDDDASDNKGQGGGSISDLIKIVNENLRNGAQDAEKEVVKRVGRSRTLVLHGTPEEIYKAKRIIQTYDLPWSQVQLDMWAFQVSGNPQEVEQRMLEIRQQATLRRDLLHASHALLAGALNENELCLQTDFRDACVKPTIDQLRRLGFNCTSLQTLSLTETFILLALAGPKTRVAVLNKWENDFRNVVQTSNLARLSDKSILPDKSIFPRTRGAFGVTGGTVSNSVMTGGTVFPDTVASDREGIASFVSELVKTGDERKIEILAGQNGVSPEPMSEEKFYRPERLANAAATADVLLRIGMDRYVTDLQELLFTPWLPQVVAKGGASLRGKTRIVVTSGLETLLEPKASSYVNTTRPKPLAFDDLFKKFDTPVKPEKSDGEAKDKEATKEAAAAARELLTGLSNSQLLALRLLTNPVEPVFTEVAPGVSINVRPSVLRDGASARLKMDVSFGLETTKVIGMENNKGVYQSVPAPMVQSHRVQTDAAIAALDLFDISSFSLQTSYPRSRYIPVIGSIPIIGELIKRPAKNKTVTHESMILVNAVIVPRALDIARLYAGETSPPNCPPDKPCPPLPTAAAPKP
jgi:hypothetical protein